MQDECKNVKKGQGESLIHAVFFLLFKLAFVGAVCGGGQRGERRQWGVAGGQDVAPFMGEKANLCAEGLGLLSLRSHELLKPLNVLLVRTSPVILELSPLHAHKQSENVRYRGDFFVHSPAQKSEMQLVLAKLFNEISWLMAKIEGS